MRFFTFQNTRSFYQRFFALYIRRVYLAVHASYVNRYMRYDLILFLIPTLLSVGYYSGGQHLARLWDSALARWTHPVNPLPKWPGCLALLRCPRPEVT